MNCTNQETKKWREETWYQRQGSALRYLQVGSAGESDVKSQYIHK